MNADRRQPESFAQIRQAELQRAVQAVLDRYPHDKHEQDRALLMMAARDCVHPSTLLNMRDVLVNIHKMTIKPIGFYVAKHDR
jgi:hypothetical protein